MRIKPKYIVFGIVIITIFVFLTNRYAPKPRKFYMSTIQDELAQSSMKIDTLNNLKLFGELGRSFLKDQFGEKSKMVIVFQNFKCSDCIKYVIDVINNYKNKIGSENILLLGKFKNDFDVTKFVKKHKIDMPLFGYSPLKGFELPVDKLNRPYVMITDNTLKPRFIFVPLEEMPERTELFFNFLIKNFSF